LLGSTVRSAFWNRERGAVTIRWSSPPISRGLNLSRGLPARMIQFDVEVIVGVAQRPSIEFLQKTLDAFAGQRVESPGLSFRHLEDLLLSLQPDLFQHRFSGQHVDFVVRADDGQPVGAFRRRPRVGQGDLARGRSGLFRCLSQHGLQLLDPLIVPLPLSFSWASCCWTCSIACRCFSMSATSCMLAFHWSSLAFFCCLQSSQNALLLFDLLLQFLLLSLVVVDLIRKRFVGHRGQQRITFLPDGLQSSSPPRPTAGHRFGWHR
jgi:hypothetical protein